MAGLHFIITADNSPFIKAMSQTKEKIKEVSMQIEKEGGNIDNLIARIAKGAAAIGLGFSATQLINDIVNVRGEFQKLSVAFETMLGSKEKADSLMKQMVETAATTPFGLQDVAGGAKQLLAYGVAAEDVNETLIRLGDIAAGLSIPLGDLVYLYGTTRAQGRLYTEDFNQFTSRGIPMIEMLAEKFGVAENEVKGLVEAGKVGFPEVQEVIENLTNEGGKFGGLMEAQSKTISGQISNIEDAFETMFNEIGKQNEGVINTALSSVSYLVEHYDKVGKSITAIAATYGTYRTALVLAKVAQDTLTARMQLSVVVAKAQTVALKALNSVMKANPYVFVATAIIGVVTAMWALHDSTTAAERAQVKFNESQKRTTEREDERRRKIEELIRTIQDETETEYSKIKAYEEIQKYSPALVSAYNREELATLSLADAQKSLNKERDKAIYQNILSNIEKYTRYVNVLQNAKSWNDLGELRSDIKSEYGIGLLSGKAEQAEADLSKWQSALDEYKKLKKEAENESKPVNVRLFEANSDLKQIESEFEKARKKLEEEQKKLSENPYHVIPFYVQIEFDNAKGKLDNQKFKVAALESELNTGKPYREAYDEAKTAYEARLRAVKDARKGTEAEYLKAVVELEEAEKRYKALGGITGSSFVKQENQAKKDVERQRKEQEQLADDLLQLRFKNQQDEINLMKEGSDKKRRQIELDYQKEIDAYNKAKAKYGETDEVNAMKSNAYNKRSTGLAAINEEEQKKEQERIKAQEDAWNEALIKFGDYNQKRKAIIEKYDKEIEQAQNAGDEWAKTEEKKAALEELDEQYGKSTRVMADLFENAGEKSVTAIQKIIDKYETLVKYLSGTEQSDGAHVTLDELKAIGFTDKDIESIERGEISIRDLTDALKNLNGELEGKSPWMSFVNDMQKSIGKIKSAKGETEKIGEGVMGIGNAVTDFAPALGEFAENIGSIFGVDGEKIQGIVGSIQGLGQTATGVGQILSGDIVGGAMSAVGGISKVVSSLDNLFGADYSEYENMKAQYDTLISVWDTLIGKKTEYIDIDYGAEAQKAADEAIRLTETQIERQRQLANMLAGSGASVGSHSLGYRVNDRMSSQDWRRLSGLVGQQVGSLGDVLSLDADVIGKVLQDEKFVSVLTEVNSEFIDYISNIESYAEQLEEIAEKEKEALTGVGLDDFRNGYSDLLADLDSDNQDFADNFEKYLQNAIFSSLVANKYKERIEKLYNQWADYADSGGKLTGDEAEQLRNDYQDIVDDMLAEREQIMKEFGWNSSSSSSGQQSASGKGFETMSQDSADELNGRFTAMYESNLRIEGATEEQTAVLKNIFETISTSLTSPFGDTGFIQSVTDTTTDSMDAMIRESMSRIADGIIGIPSLVAEGNMSLVELVNISMSSNSYLEDITIWQKKTNTLLSNMLKSIDERLKRI